jgi:hypothetical protein
MGGSMVALAAGVLSADNLRSNTAQAQEAQTSTEPPQGTQANESYPLQWPSKAETDREAHLYKKYPIFAYVSPGAIGGLSQWKPSKKHPYIHAYARKDADGRYTFYYRLFNKAKYGDAIVAHKDKSLSFSPTFVKKSKTTWQLKDTSPTEAKGISSVTFFAKAAKATASKKR